MTVDSPATGLLALCTHVEKLGNIVANQAEQIRALQAKHSQIDALRRLAETATQDARHVSQLLEVLTARFEALPRIEVTKIEKDERGHIVGLKRSLQVS